MYITTFKYHVVVVVAVVVAGAESLPAVPNTHDAGVVITNMEVKGNAWQFYKICSDAAA